MTTNPVHNASPKTRFMASNDNITKHRNLVDSREFERAADFAMMEYTAQLAQRESNSAIVGLKIVGALEFLKEFRLLSEKPEIKPLPKVSDNLSE